MMAARDTKRPQAQCASVAVERAASRTRVAADEAGEVGSLAGDKLATRSRQQTAQQHKGQHEPWPVTRTSSPPNPLLCEPSQC